ncbi:hypothetical protein ABZ608_33535 [Streptomyces sp. NPDC013172]|uniref:hypothetical protein n=1 Tax=Streptomyces sp. NPDC013172 TaxID=3155009 RepID=UPI0033DF87D1
MLSRNCGQSRTPTSGASPTTIKVSQPKVTGQTAGFATTTTLDPARGLDLKTTDAAGYSTTSTYDPLGRLTQVWNPGFPTDNNPNVKYSYNLSPSVPSAVTTQTLTDKNAYVTSISILCGGRGSRGQRLPGRRFRRGDLGGAARGGIGRDGVADGGQSEPETAQQQYGRGSHQNRPVPDGRLLPSAHAPRSTMSGSVRLRRLRGCGRRTGDRLRCRRRRGGPVLRGRR